MRFVLKLLGAAAFAAVLAASPASADRPQTLPPGSILSITQAGCGFAGCTTDTTTFFHNGLWMRESSFLPEACLGTRDERTEREALRELREIQHLLRPYAQADSSYYYDCPGCADTQEFAILTVHGTITWMSGAEDPASGSGMPEEVAAAINRIWTLVQATTNDPCFG